MDGRITESLFLSMSVCLALACTPQSQRIAVAELQERRQTVYSNSQDSATAESRVIELPAEPELANYLSRAAASNPQLQAAFERYAGAMESVVAAGSLPDPRFTYSYFIEEVETRVGPQRQSFGVAQTFPWFGKLELRSEIAREKARALGEAFESTRLGLFYQVKKVYYEYYYLSRALAVTKENVQLLAWLEEVVSTKYKVGSAEHQDLIRIQIAQGKLADRLRGLEDLRNPIMAKLNAVLNYPSSTELPWPTEILQVEGIQADDEGILSWLGQNNPRLKELNYQIAAQRKAIDLAEKDYWPDITLGANYIDTGSARMAGVSDSGKDPVIVSASVNVPIWLQKYRAGQAQARAGYQAALKDRVWAENTLLADLQMALYELRDAGRKIGFYRDTLLPKARQSLKVTETSFRTEEADFLDLIEAQRTLLEFQLLYERALADHAQRLAQVEMLIGRELPRVIVQIPEPPSQPHKFSEAGPGSGVGF